MHLKPTRTASDRDKALQLSRSLTRQRFGRASGAEPGRGIQGIAEAGIRGAATELPHGDRIQAAFGDHDLSEVQAHVGGPAAESSADLGAEAYATRGHVAFREPPSLHTAAHEAAHVVQQRTGVQLKGGVGKPDDSYERDADLVADAVVRGDSAEELLDGMGGAGAGSGQAVQRKRTRRGKGVGSRVEEGEPEFPPPEIVDARIRVQRGNGAPAAVGAATELKPGDRVLVDLKLDTEEWAGSHPATEVHGGQSQLEEVETADPWLRHDTYRFTLRVKEGPGGTLGVRLVLGFEGRDDVEHLFAAQVAAPPHSRETAATARGAAGAGQATDARQGGSSPVRVPSARELYEETPDGEIIWKNQEKGAIIEGIADNLTGIFSSMMRGFDNFVTVLKEDKEPPKTEWTDVLLKIAIETTLAMVAGPIGLKVGERGAAALAGITAEGERLTSNMVKAALTDATKQGIKSSVAGIVTLAGSGEAGQSAADNEGRPPASLLAKGPLATFIAEQRRAIDVGGKRSARHFRGHIAADLAAANVAQLLALERETADLAVSDEIAYIQEGRSAIEWVNFKARCMVGHEQGEGRERNVNLSGVNRNREMDVHGMVNLPGVLSIRVTLNGEFGEQILSDLESLTLEGVHPSIRSYIASLGRIQDAPINKLIQVGYRAGGSSPGSKFNLLRDAKILHKPDDSISLSLCTEEGKALLKACALGEKWNAPSWKTKTKHMVEQLSDYGDDVALEGGQRLARGIGMLGLSKLE